MLPRLILATLRDPWSAGAPLELPQGSGASHPFSQYPNAAYVQPSPSRSVTEEMYADLTFSKGKTKGGQTVRGGDLDDGVIYSTPVHAQKARQPDELMYASMDLLNDESTSDEPGPARDDSDVLYSAVETTGRGGATDHAPVVHNDLV